MRRTLLVLWATLAACASSRKARPEAPPAVPVSKAATADAPPATRAEPVSDVLFGQTVKDPFRWLEDEKSPEVRAWMQAQDAYARRHLQVFPGRAELVRRLSELGYVETESPPVQRGQRLFFLRRPADKNKAILYVREGTAERALLDPNAWSGGTVSLGGWVPSWDGKKVAFLQRPNAADTAILKVLDVATGEVSATDVIDGARYATPNWTPDGRGFYYVHVPMDPSIPEEERPGYMDVRFHALGSAPAKDPEVHAKLGDPTLSPGVELSRDGKTLLYAVAHGWTEDTVALSRVAHGHVQGFHTFAAAKGARYQVAAWKDQLYIRTDEGAPRQRLFRVAAAHPERAHWKEIVPEDPERLLESFAIVGEHLVLTYLHDAASELRLADLDGTHVRTVALPGLGTVGEVRGLEDRDTAYLPFTSFTVPTEVLALSVRSGQVTPWFQPKVPFEPDRYQVEQVFYPSKDGTRIPMFLVRRKDLPAPAAGAPTLLYGYGGFDVSQTPTFRALLFPWLDAGGLYAVANLRGGGEFGKAWHEAGQLHHKQNVFDDFEAAGDFLLAHHLTAPGKLAVEGGSNGGLLVGTVMTQRPELYGAVICRVPLLDMVRYERYGEGRTWAPEYGTVANAEDFKALYAYSPYHHVRDGVRYPPLLMLSSDHDDRVDPFHARKFVAALQNARPGSHPAYLRIEQHAGHGGADRVDQAVQAQADVYAFLFQQLKMGAPGPSLASGAVGGSGRGSGRSGGAPCQNQGCAELKERKTLL